LRCVWRCLASSFEILCLVFVTQRPPLQVRDVIHKTDAISTVDAIREYLRNQRDGNTE